MGEYHAIHSANCTNLIKIILAYSPGKKGADPIEDESREGKSHSFEGSNNKYVDVTAHTATG